MNKLYTLIYLMWLFEEDTICVLINAIQHFSIRISILITLYDLIYDYL